MGKYFWHQVIKGYLEVNIGVKYLLLFHSLILVKSLVLSLLISQFCEDQPECDVRSRDGDVSIELCNKRG